MHTLRVFSIISWISLPTVMYAGYALLGFLTRNGLSDFQLTFFRAGHAHAGVLLLMSLLYHHFMEQTALSRSVKVGGSGVCFGRSPGPIGRLFPTYAGWPPVMARGHHPGWETSHAGQMSGKPNRTKTRIILRANAS